jgi:hypothetical protein
MSQPDYIPQSDMGFLDWVTYFVQNLGKSLARFGFPSELYAQLKQMRDDFAQKFELAIEPATRTKVSVQAKNDARNMLKKMVRQAVKEYLVYNHAVTDPDRDVLGLPIHKTTRTRAPIAINAPDAEVDTSTIGRLIIHFFDKGGKHKKAKPAGQHGIEIAWVLSDTPPTRWDELLHSNTDTNSPFTLVFEYNQRGKTVHFALRWENTRGEKGPWGDIHSAIIP